MKTLAKNWFYIVSGLIIVASAMVIFLGANQASADYGWNGFWEDEGTNGGSANGVGSGSKDFGLGDIKSGVTGLVYDDPLTVTSRIIKVLMGAIGTVLVFFLVYGGVTYLTSAGSEDKITSAKKILTYAIIGIIVIFAAWLITDFVVSALTK